MDASRRIAAWLFLAPIVLVPLLPLASGRVTSAQTPPQPLAVVGHLGAAPRDVVVQGQYAYVATGYALNVWDLTRPAEPVKVGTLLRRGAFAGGGSNDPQRLRLDGDRAFLADRSTVRIVDISDPTAPRELGKFSLQDTSILDAAPNGNLLYVAGRGHPAGVVVVDIRDPSHATEIRRTDDGAFTWLVASGGFLLALGYQYDAGVAPALRVYDLSRPDSPVLVATHADVVAEPWDLDVDGGYLYAGTNDGLRIYDISRLPQVQEVGRFATPEPVESVCAKNGQAYIVHGDVVGRVDVTDPASPVGYPEHHMGTSWRLNGASRTDLAGGTLVMALVGSGTWVWDVTGPTPRALTHLDGDVSGLSARVAAADGWAYIADQGLVTTVDCTDPAHPVPAGTLTTGLPGELIADVATDGRYQYTLLLEPTEPQRLALLTWTQGPGGWGRMDVGEASLPAALVVSGGVAFISGQSNDPATWEPIRHLYVADVANPSSPRLVAHLELPGVTPPAGRPDLAVLDMHVLLGTYKGFRVVDVSDPTRPAVVGRLDLGNAELTALTGFADTGLLAVGSGSATWLSRATVSDPALPVVTTSTSPSWAPWTLCLSAEHLFTGAYEGVEMFVTGLDGSLPSSGRLSLPARAQDMALDGGYAYVADDDAGLYIVYTGDDDLPDVVRPTALPPTPATATSGPPATVAPSATPTDVATATRTATAGPAPVTTTVCRGLYGRVPPAAIADALANPERFYGWQMALNPSKPVGPDNPLRTCLSIRSSSTPYHPLWNSLVWRAGCP